MSKHLFPAAILAATLAGLGACADQPSEPIEHRFGDAVVRTQLTAGGDVIAEVVVDQAQPAAVLDWATADASGSLTIGERSIAVDFDRAVSMSEPEVAELAYQLWSAATADTASLRACVGGSSGSGGWECCVGWPEIFSCRSY